MTLKRLHHLFKQKMGLDPDIITNEGWQRIIKERMAICEIEDFDVYQQRLFSSSIEFQEFVELLVVPETWFFRDKASIDFLLDYAKNWTQFPQTHALRILSLPCSSGEEPYSIAMALIAALLPMNWIHIDGIDISKKAIAKAEIGEYSKNSFRSKDMEFRDHFFSELKGNYVLNPSVRQSVHFSYGNLLEMDFTDKRLPYDVIFCRNLFIYLHPDAQKKGIEILKRLLNPEGILIVSQAEAEIARSLGFASAGPLKACAFQLAPQKIPQKEAILKFKKNNEIATNFVEEEKKQKNPTLEEAKELADHGKLIEALNICHECLKKCNTNPQIYFLIGLIEHAQGHEKKSEEYFLKTVYLDPDYYEALIYLALIAEQKGEMAEAELFRTRAKKLPDRASR